MAYEHRYPVVLLCCGSFNPVTKAHIKMFEIARNFLERTGRHIVIGGVLSPVYLPELENEILCSSHRITMCKIAVKNHSWLTVDGWQSSQNNDTKPLKLLRRLTNKLRNEYGAPRPHSEYWNNRYPTTAVKLQPNGTLRNHLINKSYNTSQCLYDSSSFSSLDQMGNIGRDEMRKSELINLFGGHLQRVCCVQPPTFNYQNDSLAFGATYDLRRTKVMLLCGADILETFGDDEKWSDDEASVKKTENFSFKCHLHLDLIFFFNFLMINKFLNNIDRLFKYHKMDF